MPPLLHSTLGASSSKRWMNCPGSVALCAPIPNKSSVYADEGTAAHFLGEQCLHQGKDSVDFLGQQIAVPKGDAGPFFVTAVNIIHNRNEISSEWEVTEEMAEAVQVYLDEIRSILNTYPGAELRIEHKFHLAELHEDLWGTCDAVIVVPFHKIIVLDYKHGRGVSVSAEENSQGMVYALGAAWDEDLEEVEIVIVQPNGGRKEGGIKRWTTTRTELMDWGKNVLLPAALATANPNAPLHAGPWCRDNFCSAAGVCSALRQTTMSAAGVVFDDGLFPVEATPTLPAPSAMTSTELAKALALADLFDTWFKGLWSYAYGELTQGHDVPGFKIVRGKPGNRKYADEKKAEARLHSHLRQEAYENPKLKTPAQAEKALKALAKEGKLRDIKDAKDIKAFMDALTTRSDGRLQMVPESDPRPAVNMLPEAVFDDDFMNTETTQPSAAICSTDDF